MSGGKVGDMALHFLNKYGIMAVRLTSKWDVRRLCKSVGATPLPKLTTPTKDELGYADRVYVDELGDTSIVVFRLDSKESPIATVLVRGSTQNYMDDIERAVDDGVNTFKVRMSSTLTKIRIFEHFLVQFNYFLSSTNSNFNQTP